MRRHAKANVPNLTAKELAHILVWQFGFKEDRLYADRVILVSHDKMARTAVPLRARGALKPPVIFAVLADANITLEEFLAKLKAA